MIAGIMVVVGITVLGVMTPDLQWTLQHLTTCVINERCPRAEGKQSEARGRDT